MSGKSAASVDDRGMGLRQRSAGRIEAAPARRSCYGEDGGAIRRPATRWIVHPPKIDKS